MPRARSAADAVVSNAKIRTLDPGGTLAEAVAIKDGRIVAVGAAHEIQDLVDQHTRVIDAGGRTVLPGFIDGHTHFQKGAVSRHLLINWEGHRNPRSIEQALADVRERAATTPKGEWIRADGLAEARLAEKRLPTRWEIDAVAPDHPVMLVGTGNHSVAANSLALKLAGIDRDTEDPPGGSLERTPDGEPTGVLREMGKLRLDNNRADNVIPKYSVADRLEPLKKTIAEVHAEGITSIHDMMVDPLEIQSWIRLRNLGELKLRVQMLVRGIETKTPYEHILALGLEHGLGDEWLRFGGMKLSVDGICAYRAAAVYEPFPTGAPDNYGLLRIPQDELEAAIVACHRQGVRLAVHVVGPRAADMTMDAFEKALDGTPRPDLRHRLEHLHLHRVPGQLERARDLGLIVSAQPAFVWKIGDAWIDVWDGEDKVLGMMPLRDMLDVGLRVMGGTDFPGTPINPFLGMRSALTRLTRDGRHVDPAQAVSLDEAIHFQTTAAAYGGFEEHLKGSLEVGKLGDLVIVSEDPWRVAPERLDQDVRVDLTMVGGEVVFERQ